MQTFRLRLLVGLMPAVLLAAWSGAAQAACKLTTAQITTIAALPNPVTVNARGKYVQKGKVLHAYDVEDLCGTRRLYDLVAEREAQGQLLKASEIRPYVQYYLSDDEMAQIHKHVANVIANSAKGGGAAPSLADTWKRIRQKKSPPPSSPQ